MTGFAARTDEVAGIACAWEIRGVNARGLDIRLRLPEGIEGLEAAVRTALAGRFARGNVSLSLRLGRSTGDAAARLDPAALDAALDALAEVRAEAARRGLALGPASAAEVLTLRGVMVAEPPEAALDAAALAPGLAALLDAFAEARGREGAALAEVLAAQIDAIAALIGDIRTLLPARAADAEAAFRAALARVAEAAAEPQRVAQELALLAVKGDVTEELDRLEAHVAAARALLAEAGPIGRKLDFLAQEFNREANTLCSKAGHAALTRLGLDLKAVIEQMREQVQNVE